MSKQYVTFIDAGGRNIFGEKVSSSVAQENGPDLVVINPMVILVQPKADGSGQLAVQLIPLFLAEFVKPDTTGSRNYRVRYARNSIALGENFAFADQLVGIYEQINTQLFNTPQPAPPTPVGSPSPKVIKLFDDEAK